MSLPNGQKLTTSIGSGGIFSDHLGRSLPSDLL